MANYHLDNLGYAFLSGDVNLQEIVIPPSIDQLSKIGEQAFLGSSLTSVVFLGFSSELTSQIQKSKMFNVGHDCNFTTSDAKRFTWKQSTGIVVQDFKYQQLGSAKISNGKKNKMSLGKKIYWFEQDLYEWCVDPSEQKNPRYKNPAQCPMMIIYGDFKTSIRSMRFLHEVLEDQSFYTWLKSSVKCYVFLVDRDGDGICGSSSDPRYQFYKTIRSSSAAQDFVAVDFIYKDNYASKTFSGRSVLEFQTLATAGMSEAGFGAFDWKSFDVVTLEDPYVEAIPTGSPSVWKTPWWWNGFSPQDLPDWVVN